jgi:hypothetical protein
MDHRRIVFGLSVLSMLAFAGCKKETKVYVECVTNTAGANCTITHQQGKDPAGVCWDVKVTCANGATVIGSGCQNVQPAAKTSLIIAENQFKPVSGKCDKLAGVAVENLKIGPVLTAMPAQAAPPPAATASDYAVIPQTNVELKPPAGWTREQKGEWGLLVSPDKHVVLAFVMFDKPNESTRKLGEVAGVLGTTGIKWNSTKSINIGPDSFPAQAADGSCKFPSGDGEISYATVNPGVPQQVLIVYAADKTAPKADVQQASGVIQSMRRKR